MSKRVRCHCFNKKYLYGKDNGSWFCGNDARYVENDKREDAQKEGFHRWNDLAGVEQTFPRQKLMDFQHQSSLLIASLSPWQADTSPVARNAAFAEIWCQFQLSPRPSTAQFHWKLSHSIWYMTPLHSLQQFDFGKFNCLPGLNSNYFGDHLRGFLTTILEIVSLLI